MALAAAGAEMPCSRAVSAFSKLGRFPECLAADLPGPRLAKTLEQGLGDRYAVASFFKSGSE
jgi:hypothetical protein